MLQRLFETSVLCEDDLLIFKLSHDFVFLYCHTKLIPQFNSVYADTKAIFGFACAANLEV